MRIITSKSHAAFTDWLEKVPNTEWTFFGREEMDGVLDLDLSQYDLLLLQEPRHYVKLRQTPIKKVFFEHCLPMPFTLAPHTNHHYHLPKDPTVRAIVFATKQQAMFWEATLGTFNIIPLAIDLSEFPVWEGGEAQVLSACNDLKNRDWCCGYRVWQQVTAGVPCALAGWENGNIMPRPELTILGGLSRPEMLDCYRRYNVFFNHTTHSTLPTTIAEAMACGTPIVSTAGFTATNLLGDKYGVVTNVVHELRQAVKEIRQNPEPWREAGIRNRKYIGELWHPDLFISNWTALLENVCND